MKIMKKIFLIVITFSILFSSFCQYSDAISTGQIGEGKISLEYRNVTVYAPAVAQTETGYVGVISTITVTIQNNGNGRVFVDTLPLTQIDMQGSARLAVKVASALAKNDKNCTINPSNYDYFFVVRTSSPIIGGPSAGAVMTLATISLLENWTIDDETVMTGMINPDGSIGPIGGIPYKVDAAHSVGATRFLIPKGQGTYTEVVREITTEDGWPTIRSRQVTTNVADYAMEKYGMEVDEVGDINDALMYFTGYNFSMPESNHKITTEDYVDSMKPLATTLLDGARNQYNNASDLLNKSKSSIPNYYPLYYRDQVTELLNAAADRLDESESWHEQGFYYSSTSKSFQSLIDSRFVSYACGYFNSDDERQYITSVLNEVTSFYNNQSEEAKNADIKGAISLQCVGAAQQRASEADSYISDASISYNERDYLGMLYKLAFAMERSNSVGWWIGIASHFNDTGEISNTTLENLATEYIEDAQQAVVYSDVILQEAGGSSSYLDSAEELLTTARNDLEKGYPAAALLGAFEALAKANLAIETLDGVTNERIARARESASSSISKSRNIGIEPVLAVSYYEYAYSLENESKYSDALVYYKQSGIIAGVIDFTNFSKGSTSSRYVGTPEINANVREYDIFRYSYYLIFMAVIGGFAGLGLGLIIGSLLSKREKEEYGHWTPRSIEDYYKKNK
jgi:uncharacterized protein